MQSVTQQRAGCAIPASCRSSNFAVHLRHQSVLARPGACRQRSKHVVAAEKKKFGSFDELLSGSELPLLVDFYATWCGPCQMLAPVLSSLSKRMEGRIQVVKIDSDKYPAIASKYKVMALPTMVLFKGGQPVARFEGLMDEQSLYDQVAYHVGSQ